MATHPSAPVDEQAELMSALLEGAGPDCYVVIPVEALVTQMLIAMRETRNRRGEVRPGMASARLIRSLDVLGWTRNTKHTETAEAPHSRACKIARHEHGRDCHYNCPSCGGVER